MIMRCWRGASLMPTLRAEGAGRDQARRDVGVVQRVELGPQHVALEAHGIDGGRLLLRRRGVALDVVEGEVGVAVGLVEAALEILHGPLADEIVALQHAGDALAVDGRREQLGQRGGHRLQQRALAHEIDVGLDGEARGRQRALHGDHVGAVEAQRVGEHQPALDAALLAAGAVMIEHAMHPFAAQLAVVRAAHQGGILARHAPTGSSSG